MITNVLLALLASITVLSGPLFHGSLGAQEKPLRIYGSESPFAAMTECAERFTRIHGIKTEVVTGQGAKWVARAREDADIVYEETEYNLTHLINRNPCILDEHSRISLYAQPAGILVRKGNPKGIRSLKDLAGAGIYLLDVDGEGYQGLWEDVAGKKGLIPEIRKRIGVTVETSAEAIEKWRTAPALDAWITFESWHYRLKDLTDLVRLPKDERTYRGTAAVATHYFKNRDAARMFLEFLKTPECHAVFKKWGWE